MDTLKKHLKPWDIVIIIVVTVASFTPLVDVRMISWTRFGRI